MIPRQTRSKLDDRNEFSTSRSGPVARPERIGTRASSGRRTTPSEDINSSEASQGQSDVGVITRANSSNQNKDTSSNSKRGKSGQLNESSTKHDGEKRLSTSGNNGVVEKDVNNDASSITKKANNLKSSPKASTSSDKALAGDNQQCNANSISRRSNSVDSSHESLKCSNNAIKGGGDIKKEISTDENTVDAVADAVCCDGRSNEGSLIQQEDSNSLNSEPRRCSSGLSVNDRSDRDSDSCKGSVSGKRRRSRPGLIFQPGAKLEAKDFQNKWYPAKIVEADEEEGEILIHFEGWSHRFNEWLPMDSPRLRAAVHPSTRKEQKLKPVKHEYKKGEEVLARWTDCKMYPAKVTDLNNDGTYIVLYYDGFHRRVKSINLEKMPTDMKGKVDFADILQKNAEAKKQPPEIKKANKKPPEPAKIPRKRGRSSSSEGKVPEKALPKTKPVVTGNKKKILIVGGKFAAKRSRDEQPPAKKQKISGEGKEKSKQKDEKQMTPSMKDPAGVSQAKAKEENTAVATVIPPAPAKCTPDGRRIAPKEFIIEEDHNHFKCPIADCNKSFRKEVLLGSHIKHYHRDDSTSGTPSRKSHALNKSAAADRSPTEISAENKEVISMDTSESHSSLDTTLADKAPTSVSETDTVFSVDSEKSQQGEISTTVSPENPELQAISTSAVESSVKESSTMSPEAPVDSRSLENLQVGASSSSNTPVETVSTDNTDTSDTKSTVETAEVPSSTPATVQPEVQTVTTSVPELTTPVAAPLAQKKGGRRSTFIPHFETLAASRERRKIAKTAKALIADMEAAASKRGGRKRTSSTRSDKSDKSDDKKAKEEGGKSVRKSRSERVSESDAPHQKSEGESESGSHRNKRKKHLSSGDTNGTTSTDGNKGHSENKSSEGGEKDGPSSVKVEASESSAPTEEVSEYSNEVVHCICNCDEENGLMMQCEVCLTWQHGTCFDIEEEEQVPDKYVCYACLNPKGVRESFRYRHDQDWFTKGEMASFKFLKDKIILPSNPSPVLATHELVASMHNVFKVLHSLKYKLNVCKDNDHTDLKLFTSSWTEKPTVAPNQIEDPKQISVDIKPSIDPSLLSQDDKALVPNYDHSYFAHPVTQDDISLVNGVQEAPDIIISTGTDDTGEVIAQEVPLENMVVGCDEVPVKGSSIEPMAVDVMSGTLQGSSEPVAGQSLDQMQNIKQEPESSECNIVSSSVGSETSSGSQAVKTSSGNRTNSGDGQNSNPEICKVNLLNHIFQIQDDLEHRLDTIEEQLQALETEANFRTGSSGDDDLLRLKLSMKGLMKDLNSVQRLTLFR